MKTLPSSNTEQATMELMQERFKNELQPCGHPKSAVVSSDEGTSYCGECEREARDK